MSFRRTDRGPFAEWWWTVDKAMLAAVFLLCFAGLILNLAASPSVAVRLGQPEYHFVLRQMIFFGPALVMMIVVSMLGERHLRRLALVMCLGGMALMVIAILFGTPIKGSSRWLSLGPMSLQPSELVKPAFTVLAAWFFAEGARRKDIPGTLLAFLLFGIFAGLLILQPDLGQTMLATFVWGALFFMAGMSWFWVFGLGGLAIGGLVFAYFALPHVTARIDQFLYPAQSDTFQVDTAREAILHGGWLGLGPGEGTVKRILPDAHTDFVFAVLAEEFGIVACLGLVAVFAFIVLRGLSHATQARSAFERLAIAGLSVLIGVQAGINMAVNLALLPAKGMTLPFISYGGSSLLSVAIAMGMLLALTRRRPGEFSQGEALGVGERQGDAGNWPGARKDRRSNSQQGSGRRSDELAI